MNSEQLNSKLKELRIEDFIWIIYIGIIILSWYSNSLERKYFIFNNLICKKKYRSIMILIFSVLTVVYLYFLKNSIEDIRNLQPYDSQDKKNLIYLSFLASLFIVTSGFIFLYIAIKDVDLNVELAFN